MFPGHDSHVYNKAVQMYANTREYVLTAYMQRQITESTCFLCAQQLNTVLLVRDEPFTAPPTVRGFCLEHSGLRTRH